MFAMAAVCVSPVSAEVVGYTTPEGIVYNVDTSSGTAALARVEASTGITELVVPDVISYNGDTYDVVAVADGACINNALLQKVEIGDKVVSVGNQSFYGCQTLESATLPASLKTVGDQAFYNCKKLLAPALPEGLESIGSYAFWSNNMTTEVNLPSTLVTLGGNPWGCCPALSAFTISEELNRRPQFRGCRRCAFRQKCRDSYQLSDRKHGDRVCHSRHNPCHQRQLDAKQQSSGVCYPQ